MAEQAPTGPHRYKSLKVKEVSLVDFPANEQEFLVIKSADGLAEEEAEKANPTGINQYTKQSADEASEHATAMSRKLPHHSDKSVPKKERVALIDAATAAHTTAAEHHSAVARAAQDAGDKATSTAHWNKADDHRTSARTIARDRPDMSSLNRMADRYSTKSLDGDTEGTEEAEKSNPTGINQYTGASSGVGAKEHEAAVLNSGKKGHPTKASLYPEAARQAKLASEHANNAVHADDRSRKIAHYDAITMHQRAYDLAPSSLAGHAHNNVADIHYRAVKKAADGEMEELEKAEKASKSTHGGQPADNEEADVAKEMDEQEMEKAMKALEEASKAGKLPPALKKKMAEMSGETTEEAAEKRNPQFSAARKSEMNTALKGMLKVYKEADPEGFKSLMTTDAPGPLTLNPDPKVAPDGSVPGSAVLDLAGVKKAAGEAVSETMAALLKPIQERLERVEKARGTPKADAEPAPEVAVEKAKGGLWTGVV